MHVVLLNQAFAPDVVATAQMSKDLADELVARGHRVTAVASRSIYGQSGAALARRERIDGVEVYRVGASVFGKKGLGARAADFLLFYVLAGLKVLTMPRADVVVSFTTPPFIGCVGLVARLLRGSRAVYWVMDVYPDVPVACGMMSERGLLTRFFEGVNRLILRRSDASVVLGRCMRDRVLAKGAPEKRVHLIPVWAIEAGIEPVKREENGIRERWGVGDDFVVMYSGNFGIAHDAGTICGAMEALKDEEGLRFEFVGGGKRREEVERFIGEKGIGNARWHGYVARERLGESLGAGDVHLVSIKEGLEGLIVPSKLFGILAAGRPAVFVGSPESEIARVLVEYGCGVVVREGDVEGLVTALRELKGDRGRCEAMGAKAAGALVGRFDKATACAAWAELLEGVVEGKGGRRTSAARDAA